MAFLPTHTPLSRAFADVKSKANIILKIIIALATVILVMLMFPRGEAIEYEYKVGGVWVEKDLIAPFSFPIFKDDSQYEKERQEAAAAVSPVFERQEHLVIAQRESLKVMMGRLHAGADVLSRRMLRRAPEDSVIFMEIERALPFTLTPKQWEQVQLIARSQRRFSSAEKTNVSLEVMEKLLNETLSEVLRIGIVDERKLRKPGKTIAIRQGTEEAITPSERVYDVEDALNTYEARVVAAFGEGDAATIAIKVLRATLRPNLIYNDVATAKLVEVAVDNVPRTIGFVQENERIVAKHERITPEVKLKLDSLRKSRAERGVGQGTLLQDLGIAIHVTLVITLYSIYFFLFRKRIYRDNTKLILIALLILMQCFFAYLSLAIEVAAPTQYLIFVPAASMLLTIIFDSRVAFYGTVTIAFLIAGIRGNDYSVALASLIAGALSVYTVRDIKHRTQIFRSLIFIFLGYALVILALGLERFATATTILTELTFALSNAVFSPVLTYGLLIFFERVFKVTTDLTLLELSDFNHPLLRQLSQKTPGTFHHSVTMGSLAEAAAEAIGANAILARVGAYYHDIGKIVKPEYFTENQQYGKNKHMRLSPRMSALIIASHVKEGVELGREFGLPGVVLDFIPQHHGTTRISFFYDKALKQAAARKSPRDDIREEDYRYPGPKPQTKETGILMLADAVEATARVLENSTPQRLEEMIDNLIKSRFVEGQLDECELTLRDLSKIKAAFLKILVGIHHTRIKYPEPEQPAEEKAAPAEAP